MSKINLGDTVKVNYTGKFEDGSIFDSSLSEGRTPLEVKLGQGHLIKGFENALVGMEINESKSIEVSPEEGYGNRIDMLVQEIPKEQIGSEVNVGDVLQASGPQGNIMVKVLEVMENSVLLDANHPLAGKTLYFDIEVLEINS